MSTLSCSSPPLTLQFSLVLLGVWPLFSCSHTQPSAALKTGKKFHMSQLDGWTANQFLFDDHQEIPWDAKSSYVSMKRQCESFSMPRRHPKVRCSLSDAMHKDVLTWRPISTSFAQDSTFVGRWVSAWPTYGKGTRYSNVSLSTGMHRKGDDNDVEVMLQGRLEWNLNG